MARTIKTVEIEGQSAVTLFDSGAIYTYVCSALVGAAPRRAVTRPVHVTLGGREIDIQELCRIEGKIEGLDFFAEAVPVADLGRADDYELDAVNAGRSNWTPRQGRWTWRG
ncbi:MAG TPA: hypothetical protein PKL16_12415 [Anaerolineae bacterium]|nr:hypothetical protein [Anaerolineae bacterium]